MQSPLFPALIIISSLLLAFTLFAVALRLILRNLKQLLRRRLTERLLPGETILAEDFRANFFGLQSLGGAQFRGNGLLVLTDQALVFQMLLPSRTFRIALTEVTGTSIVRSHCGKTIARNLLKVSFGSQGREDAMAWFVPEAEQWQRQLDAAVQHRPCGV
ncbi:MAG: hypothetical protein ACKO2P_14185 [Planctomycetota bacterium]